MHDFHPSSTHKSRNQCLEQDLANTHVRTRTFILNFTYFKIICIGMLFNFIILAWILLKSYFYRLHVKIFKKSHRRDQLGIWRLNLELIRMSISGVRETTLEN